MQFLKKFFVVACLSFLSITSASAYNTDSIIVFGDSLSDTGRLYQLSTEKIPYSPPYYHGRFSNGPVWVEYLSQKLGKSLKSYAIGGASTNIHYDLETTPVSLSMEVTEFLFDHIWDSKSSYEKRLYIIWTSANDYWNETGDPQASTKAVVDTIVGNVRTLVDYGGRYFLLPNLPDLSNAPYSVMHSEKTAQLRNITIAHNNYFAAQIAQLRKDYPDRVFILFDLSQLLSSDMGFSNMTTPCYDGGYYGDGKVIGPTLSAGIQPIQSIQSIENDPRYQELDSITQIMVRHSVPLQIAMSVSAQEQARLKMNTATGVIMSKSQDDIQYKCTGYFFWDSIHPTTKAHELLAIYATQVLKQSGF